MTSAAWWVLWIGLALGSFFVLEWRALAAKARGERSARTLTDMVRTWTKSIVGKVMLAGFMLWLTLHFLGVTGL